MKEFTLGLVLIISCGLPTTVRAVHAAEAGESDWNVEEYAPIDLAFAPEGEMRWERSIAYWSCVPPDWIVGVISEGPGLGSAVSRSMLASWRHYGAVAVNTRDGHVKWVTCDGASVSIDSVIPVGTGTVGIVMRENDAWRGRHDYKIREWDLTTDVIGPARGWNVLLNPVARLMDLNKVALDLTVRTDGDMPTLRLLSRTASTSEGVELPLPFREYETPMDMSALWEEGRETRWYAASDSGMSIVGFRGLRSGEWRLREAFSPMSTLTVYDPEAADGVRWERSLAEITGSGGKGVMRLSPIEAPWARSETLVVEWIEEDVQDEVAQGTVHIAELRLRDGSVVRQGQFANDSSYSMSPYTKTRWPALSPNHNRIVFLDERQVTSRLLQVFDFREGRLREPVQDSFPEGWGSLLAILPTDEALLQGTYQLWAVGVGDNNYGDTRPLCRLFIDDVNP